MDFYIETSDLQKAIKLLSVTAKMNTKDATGLVLLEAGEDGTITFLSNNNSTALSYISNGAKVEVPGIVAFEYGKIKSFIASFRPWNEKRGVRDFHFRIKDNQLSISVSNIYESGKISKGTLNLRTYDTHSIRKPAPFEEPNFVLNSNIFRTATSKVLYSIDPSEARPFIQGMDINFDEENIYFVGTQGRMLSEYQIKNISDITEGDFILKYDFIMGLRRALGEETQIAFEFDNRVVKAAFDNICLWGQNIIGHTFPPYKKLLNSFEYTIVLNKDVLLSNLLPFQDVLNPDDNYRLTFAFHNKNMMLSNEAASFEYDEEVNFDGDYVIDVNGMFMIQTVDVIKDDQILIKFSDDEGVIILDSGNFEDQKALITPIRRR